MSNQTMNDDKIKSYMNKIDDCRDREAIGDLSVLAYQLVTEMSQDIKLREDAGAIVVKSQLDTGLKEFREQINIILTENPLMPLDEADKRLRDRMKDNAEQAVVMIEKIINAIALTVAILKQKVGDLERQLTVALNIANPEKPPPPKPDMRSRNE